MLVSAIAKIVVQWRCFQFSANRLLTEQHRCHSDKCRRHRACVCISDRDITQRISATRRLGIDAILTSARENLVPSGSRKSYRDRDFVVRILAPWYLRIPIAWHNVWGQDICAIRGRVDYQYRVSQFSIVSDPSEQEPRVALPPWEAPEQRSSVEAQPCHSLPAVDR